MNKLKELQSVLTLKSLVVNEITFKRDVSYNENIDLSDSQIRFGREISGEDDENTMVSLSILLKHKESKTNLFIKVTGIFGFQSEVEDDFKMLMLERNAVAIIFPYLRSQLSIVTAQPGVLPFVLPAINIVALLKKDDNSDV